MFTKRGDIMRVAEFLTDSRVRFAGAVLVGTAALTGCSAWNDERGRGDAPVGERHEEPRETWQNVDKFPNIVAFCIGENGVYTNTRTQGDPVDIVVGDPNCTEGGELVDPES